MRTFPNIVWILVDSVRSYHTDEDDRGKLPMMDRFGDHSVEFLNVVTSAASTIMSISAMMTSLPSYFVARNYDDFLFDRDSLLCFGNIMKENGYFTMAFFRHPHPREKFRNLLTPVPRKFWEPSLKHREVWNNQDLRAVINNVLDSGVPTPAFLFTHFTCRLDPNTSDIVEATLSDFLNAGFTYDNTIFVLCSDHGYPDPSRGFTPEGLKRAGLTHDLILTDDNIKIPLYIRYPGCEPQKIETTVSSLDIAPTILDFAGIQEPRLLNPLHGRSLKTLIEGRTSLRPGSEYVRSDARLMYQTDRITAIRGDRFKYLRHHDKPAGENEELYDLVQDPLEGEDIASRNEYHDILATLRSEFERSETQSLRYQIKYALDRFELEARKRTKSDLEHIVLLLDSSARYGDVALQVIMKTWPAAKIDIVLPENDLNLADVKGDIYKYSINEKRTAASFVTGSPDRVYDVLLLFVINPANSAAKVLLKLSKEIPAGNTIVLDCNMNAYRRRGFWTYRVREALTRLRYGYEEPSVLFSIATDTYHVLKKRFKQPRAQ